MSIDERDFDRLWHAVFGNGKEGMDEMIRRNTAAIAAIQAAGAQTNQKLDDLKSSVDALRKERAADQHRREGAVAALGWLKAALGVLAAVIVLGGGLGLWKVSSQNQTVLEVLQKLPVLPE